MGQLRVALHALLIWLPRGVLAHPLGVCVLGMVTLFASRYVVSERLFPILSVASGALVLAMGLSLFVARLRHAVGAPAHHHHTHHERGHGRFLPVASALVIAAAGAAICCEALKQAGLNVAALLTSPGVPTTWLTAASVLGVGLVFGLKHALDADHLAAVSTIVTESKSLLSSSLVGAVWGVGHTLALLVAGVAVILLHVEISERTALALEFCVAVMLIGLGANALRTLARGGRVHLHAHEHYGHVHLHPHLHDAASEPPAHTHHRFHLSLRSLLVGMVHGLAGSAALMLLVLSTIPSPLLGLAYIAVFGMGSIGGMLFMSALVAVPARLTAERFNRTHVAIRTLAGVLSLGFGLLMAYQIGVAGGLLL